MLKFGFIGWRGMVGSVLMERIGLNRDIDSVEALYYSTSQVGQPGPGGAPLLDADDVSQLEQLDVIVTCQGSGHTKRVYPALRSAGWSGYWVDASSALRMADDAVIVLDPINRAQIDAALKDGIKTFIGGNCTVSLMLMAIGGLLRSGHVEWVSTMTYQSASGAGAKFLKELVSQMGLLGSAAQEQLVDPAASVLEIDRIITQQLHSPKLASAITGVPLAASLIPWIDSAVEEGQTREEWKGQVETNKILGTTDPIPVDGICVRVGAMRCHSQGLTIKLKEDLPLDEVEALIKESSEWTRVIPNAKTESMQALTPAAVSGTLEIPVGRIRKMKMGPRYVAAFTVGDQLLWGAAEPLRRMLPILKNHLG